MTNFVKKVEEYVEREGKRMASSDDELLRRFAHGNRKDMEDELLAVYPEPDPADPKSAARIKASVQRQLQKWGLTGAVSKKVVRGPLARSGGKLAPKTRLRLRIILLRRRNARVLVNVYGTVRYHA